MPKKTDKTANLRGEPTGSPYQPVVSPTDAPYLYAESFYCPHCNAYAHQKWGFAYNYRDSAPGLEQYPGLSVSTCSKCKKFGLWVGTEMVYPICTSAPPPGTDMPENVKEDYLEAGNVCQLSPRSAAALLRLALQKLMPSLGEKGKDINSDIGSLVKKGLDPPVQQALDAVRVIGNEAVHPGTLDLRDDMETAFALFKLLNYIVERMITHPKQIKEIYRGLPDQKLDGIRQRDSNR
jgi:hypothetical protein